MKQTVMYINKDCYGHYII